MSWYISGFHTGKLFINLFYMKLNKVMFVLQAIIMV